MKKELKKIKKASKIANLLSDEKKSEVLIQMANEILAQKDEILKSNEQDLKLAVQNNLSQSLIDRLRLDEQRITQMISSIIQIADQIDPIGRVLSSKTLPNGLKLDKISVPIGVIAIIYESRPNVTSDSAALCFKSGNICILKGGKEALNSNLTIVNILRKVLEKNSLPKELINYVNLTREELKALIKQQKFIDLIIPRGGEKLIDFVSKYSQVPLIKHNKGLCHIYIDKDANLEKSLQVCINAKCQRSSVCNAVETLLIHELVAQEFLPRLKEEFDKYNTKLKGCEKTLQIIDIQQATKRDWNSEYLDNILSIKIVKNISKALKHIEKYGSNHSEAIMSENDFSKKLFLSSVDASCVYANASTRFTDGGVFGLGAEIGISTNKLHVRGPVGADDLTTYKYKIYGNGQIREQ